MNAPQRILNSVTVLALVGVLTACGETEQAPVETSETETPAAEVAAEPEAPAEEAVAEAGNPFFVRQ